MQAYRVETTGEQDGTLTLSNLPLRAGKAVEVISGLESRTVIILDTHIWVR